MTVRLYFAFAMILGLGLQAKADIEKPVTSTFPFMYNSRMTEAVQVEGVKVVVANYDLIARDFPKQRRAANEPMEAWHARVDEWLVKETGYILKKHARKNETNTPIRTTSETKNAIRPKGYNRAHLISVDDGVMDAKGVGTENPKRVGHGDGLATLGEMIREFLFERLVTRIFDHAGESARTVGNYAVMDYGFDVVHADGSKSRAGYILRQAHVRSPLLNSYIPDNEALRVELLLRKYGISTAGDTFHMPNAYPNVQGTNNRKTTEVLDFGAYVAMPAYKQAISSRIAGAWIIPQTSKHYVAPDQNLAIPLELWGPAGETLDPKMDRPFVWSHELAEAWADGRADRSAVNTHIENLLGPVYKKLTVTTAASCRSAFAIPVTQVPKLPGFFSNLFNDGPKPLN